MARRGYIVAAGACSAVVLVAAAAVSAFTKPATAHDGTETAPHSEQEEQQRQPTACEALAIRAQQTIDAYSPVPVPGQLRDYIAPGINAGCEAVRQKLG